MLEMSAKHHIPQAKDIPYQPLLIKPIHVFNVLAHAEKQFFFSKLVFLNLSVLTSDSKFFYCSLGGGGGGMYFLTNVPVGDLEGWVDS